MKTRLTKRVPVNVKIVSQVDPYLDQKHELVAGNSFDIKAVNISISGVGIVSPHYMPVGLVIDLSFDGKILDFPGAFTVRGSIKHCNSTKNSLYKCGVEFQELSKVFMNALNSFISEHNRRQSNRLGL